MHLHEAFCLWKELCVRLHGRRWQFLNSWENKQFLKYKLHSHWHQGSRVLGVCTLSGEKKSILLLYSETLLWDGFLIMLSQLRIHFCDMGLFSGYCIVSLANWIASFMGRERLHSWLRQFVKCCSGWWFQPHMRARACADVALLLIDPVWFPFKLLQDHL